MKTKKIESAGTSKILLCSSAAAFGFALSQDVKTI